MIKKGAAFQNCRPLSAESNLSACYIKNANRREQKWDSSVYISITFYDNTVAQYVCTQKPIFPLRRFSFETENFLWWRKGKMLY